MRFNSRWFVIGVAVPVLAAGLTLAGVQVASGEADCDASEAYRYVAGGDGVPEGKDADTPSTERYSTQLLNEHLKTQDPVVWPGPWCEYSTAKDKATSDDYQHSGNPTQQSEAWNKTPRLITLTLGRQNSTIIDHVDKCFKNIKDHDFLDANVCALAVLANQNAFNTLRNDLSVILNDYKVQQDRVDPRLIVAVTGYFNPYNSATTVATKIPGFCADLQDTIPTCIARWILLPPALITLDQVVKKLNDTIEPVVKQFTISSQGRFFFVNPYEKFKDHCMQMNVEIKTKVYHPTNTVHDHNATKNFGCDEGKSWIASDKTDGTKTPFLYLTPAVTGVLILATQTTKDMGINPNKKGHDCIAQMIWEATKNKLGVPEKPLADSEICSDPK
ncbi:MAG: hypothetical protein JJD92_04715 [Frankiaceae bacterium]|nr:hypothetical protein [Frankiaceae bacterium]